MANSQVVQVETLRSLAFGSITGSYVAVGTQFTHPIRMLCITNTTNANMLFSIDGTNDHFIVPASSFKLFDFVANRLNVDQIFAIASATQVWVKQVSVPASGSVYVEAIYGTTPSSAGGL